MPQQGETFLFVDSQRKSIFDFLRFHCRGSRFTFPDINQSTFPLIIDTTISFQLPIYGMSRLLGRFSTLQSLFIPLFPVCLPKFLGRNSATEAPSLIIILSTTYHILLRGGTFVRNHQCCIFSKQDCSITWICGWKNVACSVANLKIAWNCSWQN